MEKKPRSKVELESSMLKPFSSNTFVTSATIPGLSMLTKVKA
jgi:hypothetical protein